MIKLNLFLQLMEITHTLIEDGVTIDNAHYALMQMDSAFDDFEENEGVALSAQQENFQEIFFTLKYMPEEFKQYFQPIEAFNNLSNDNDIYLKDLPPRFRATTTEQMQLIAGLFCILNELLAAGINSCHNHQARTHINKLFHDFVANEHSNKECFEDDTPDHLSYLFPDLKQQLGGLTLFPE